jgi:hypothetical protein
MEGLIRYAEICLFRARLNKSNFVTKHDILSEAFIFDYENGKGLFYNIAKAAYEQKLSEKGRYQKGKKVSKDYQKQCCKCKKVKNQEFFRHQHSKKYNINYLSSMCKDCENAYKREWRKNRIAKDPEYRIKENEASRKRQRKAKNMLRENERRREKRLNDEAYRLRVNERSKLYKRKWRAAKKNTNG